MSTAAGHSEELAHEVHGPSSGTPVVFLHGLTFDRRLWKPIVERLGGHRVHLYDPDRFATTLRIFIDRCTTGPGSTASAEPNKG